mmetsp:Transcript_50162/g.106643  ORF Transcript_50162/g.106643 Transcript_50162/m.106643 type:complete len:152 (-) Transcript_50162:75-530(-)
MTLTVPRSLTLLCLVACLTLGSEGACPPVFQPTTDLGARGGLSNEGAVMMGPRRLPGGASDRKAPDVQVRDLLVQAKVAGNLMQYCKMEGYSLFVALEPCFYTTQVVAGTIYAVTLSIEPDDGSFFEVKIFKPLPHLGEPPSIQEIKRVRV